MNPSIGYALFAVALVVAIWLGFVLFRALIPPEVWRRLFAQGSERTGDPSRSARAPAKPKLARTKTAAARVEPDMAPAGSAGANTTGPAAAAKPGVPDAVMQQLAGVNRSRPAPSEELEARLKRLAEDYMALTRRLAAEGRSDTSFSQSRPKILAAVETGQFERAQALLEHASERDAGLGKRDAGRLGPILAEAAEARALAGELKMLQLQPGNAVRFFREAVALIPADQPLLLLNTLDRWGDAAAAARDIAAAAQPWQRALELRELALGSGHRETMESRDRLIGLYIDAKQADFAKAYLDKSIAAVDQTPTGSKTATAAGAATANMLPGDDSQIIVRLKQLGALLRDVGKFGEAADHFELALERYQQRAEAEPARLAAELASLALLRRQAGDVDAARRHYGRALAMFRRVLGDQHPDLVKHLDIMADLHAAQGDGASALGLLKEAEAIERLRFGDWHSRVVARLYAIGKVQTMLGLSTEAEATLQQGLKMHEEIEGPDHADVATGLELLGGLYAKTGRDEAAVPLLERALGIAEFTHGLQHHALAPRLSLLSEVYRRVGRGQAAIAAEHRAAEVRNAAAGQPAAQTPPH
ncbi:MAG: tetratricopeptide repeat protein [Alphaproteobacteria bacterium]|nr:tetratricopeptide repeat protein [Alphaproteobacteria bacterium]